MRHSALEVAVIGAGSRGTLAYGAWALKNPRLMKVIAVAEPDDIRRKSFADAHGIPENMQFRAWQEFLDARPRRVVAVLNTLQDRLHSDSAVAILEAGYHQLLEKPMAVTPHDCMDISAAAKRTGRILAICHVLRYTPFFQAMKALLASGDMGDLVCGEFKENVAFWHQLSAFVRGAWSVKATSSPMILAKSCHDLDLLVWLTGRKAVRVSSFGGLKLFRPENAPPGAPERCLDGCPHEPQCPFSAQKNHLDGYIGGSLPAWSVNYGLVGVEPTREAKVKHLRETKWGLCAYRAGNDVVDHQSVMIEFEDGITINFLMHGFATTKTLGRTMRFQGTKGEARGTLHGNEIVFTRFLDMSETVIRPGVLAGGHSGGDTAMMQQFAEAVSAGDPARILTNVEVSLESHLLAFAAEESRLNNGRVIEMSEYRARIQGEVAART